MSDISVESKIEMRKIGEIKPYERNPRKNDKTVELLCKVIPLVGFNVPIVIDPDGVIVKGHARYAAAKKMGMSEVPCVVTHADKEAIRADRISDNKISEFSEWLDEALMHEVDMLSIDYDFSDMGLPRMSFDSIPTFDDVDFNEEQGSEEDQEEKKRRYQQFLESQKKEAPIKVQIVNERQNDQKKTKQESLVIMANAYAVSAGM